MRRVSGPYKGYFIAAWTAPLRGGFVGYGKVCVSLPAQSALNHLSADAVSSVYPEESMALAAAEHKTRLEIEQMEPSWAPFTVPGFLVDSTK